MRLDYEHLAMENFGPYRGRQVLQFASTRDGSPVTMVDGQNGFGKTSILHAFHWLLYGDQDLQRRTRRINKTALEERDTTMKVELVFKRGDETHQIVRTLDAPPGVAAKSFRENLVYLIDGEAQPNKNARIREVLPEPASQFFFFDGAKIQRYADLENSQEVRDAIELVLGLPAYENAARHLRKLQDRWEKRFREEQARNQSAQELVRTVEAHRARIEELGKDRDDGKASLDDLRQQADALQAELQKFDSLRDRLARIRETETNLGAQKDALQALRREAARSVRRAAQWHVRPLLAARLERLQAEEEELRTTATRSKKRAMADEILALLRNESARMEASTVAAIEQILHTAYPAGDGVVDEDQLAKLRVDLGRLSQKVTALDNLDPPEDVKTQLRAQRTRVAKLETELKDLRRNLGDVSEEEALSLTQQYDHVQQQIGQATSRVDGAEEDLKTEKKLYDEAQRQLEKMERSTQAERFASKAKRAADLANAFEIMLEQARNLKRKSIEEHATAIFRKLTRKANVYDRFRINDDYTLALLDHSGVEERRDMISAGEKQLVALSFIVGLMMSTDRTAPLVIDTPFGHLDKMHRKNVAEHLPSVGQQITFLVTDADIQPEYADALKATTGRSYRIDYNERAKVSALTEVR